MILIEDIDTEDERGQELVTTTFIFPELALLSLNSASLSLPITPVSPVRIKFVSLAREGSRFGEVHDISHFPPIKLTISLPDGYPSNAPPDVELESLWVPNAALERLKSEIRHIWEDVRDQVVFAVIDHLSQAAERTFDLAEKLWKEDGSWEHLLHLPGEIQDELVSFNRAMLKETFDKGTYDCGVCLEPKKGSACHKLYPCDHVFCKSCLIDFYTSCITEGDVNSVKCLDTTCILNKKPKAPPAPALPPPLEAEREAEANGIDIAPIGGAPVPPTLHPSVLTDIGLSRKLVDRYDDLKRKAALAADPATIYCPRSWCQGPSRTSNTELDSFIALGDFYLTTKHLDPSFNLEEATVKNRAIVKQVLYGRGSDTSDTKDVPDRPKDRMAVCSKCDYAFCSICTKGWHGYFLVCRPKDAHLTEEEIATEEFLKQTAIKCPSCLSWCVKSHGCNHMTCKCATHFCFLCGSYLMPAHPYKHFNSQGTPCYNRLFEGEEGDMGPRLVGPDDGDIEFIFG